MYKNPLNKNIQKKDFYLMNEKMITCIKYLTNKKKIKNYIKMISSKYEKN